MKIKREFLSFAIAATVAVFLPAVSLSQESTTPNKPIAGTYFSLTQFQAPLPFNPFPELPVSEVKPGVFVFDDRSVDYAKIRAEIAAKEAETKAGSGEPPSGGGMAMLMSGGGPVLTIELTGDDGRRVSFTAQPGFVYAIEQSTDLISWSALDTVVADDTNEAFYAFGTDNRFYRVIQGSDLIQFPNFHAVVEQSSFIDVYTPLQGTATVEIYRDGNLWYAVQGEVPVSGFFRVSDGLYNPANWPFDGYYNATNWEYRVTIVSQANATTTQTNQGIVFKKGRIRPPVNTGITVYQRRALPENLLAAVEDEFLEYMRLYFLANLQASRQVDLDGALLDESIERTQVPAIYNSNDVARLKTVLFATLTNQTLGEVDRLHYFGHGTNTGFSGIRIDQVRTNISCIYPFTYVALDGCRTAQTTDLLGEFTCYWKATTRSDLRDRGLTPAFGCGWNNTKTVAYFPTQGSLLDNHFYFWVDFYGLDGGLTHRDLPNGYFDKTFDQAYAFAKDPMGNGVKVGLLHNSEAGGWVRVGCTDCFFDDTLPPP